MVTAGYRRVALWRAVLFFGCCVGSSAVVAFTTASTTARWTTSRPLGLPLDLDPTSLVETTSIVVSAAATAAAKATAASTTTTTATGSSTAVSNFLAGSLVLIGIVGTFKWNNAESSEEIRTAWDKIVDSTSSFGTAPPTQPSTARMESKTTIAAPDTVATPTTTVTTTTTDAVATTKVTTTAVSMPQPKDAASPEELIDMMKNVSDTTTTTTKKRFLVRLLKKIVMPWKKWSNC